jgi:hypothetical protein
MRQNICEAGADEDSPCRDRTDDADERTEHPGRKGGSKDNE